MLTGKHIRSSIVKILLIVTILVTSVVGFVSPAHAATSPWRYKPCANVVAMAPRVGFTRSQANFIGRIAMRESRCNNHAISRTGDHCAVQINKRAHARWIYARYGWTMSDLRSSLYRCLTVARRLFVTQGWRPWR